MRIIYLGYYIKKMNWPLLLKFYRYVHSKSKKSYFFLIYDNIYSVFKYNISILEYFQFKFYEKDKFERVKWAGTGFMYETILKLNNVKYRYKLSDKKIFLSHYHDFVNHDFISIHDLSKGDKDFSFDRKLVLKNAFGQCGEGVQVLQSWDGTRAELIQKMKESDADLLEEYIHQHEDLSKLSPSGLNTLRIITTLDDNDKVNVLGVRLRITINSSVDNLAAGNIAAAVDPETGIVTGPGVYSDITKRPESTHPITGESVLGFKIPFFHESINLVKQAALFDKSNRSIGWDIAISNEGPSLLEGNHDWCKLLWQLPVNEGLKSELDKYVK